MKNSSSDDDEEEGETKEKQISQDDVALQNATADEDLDLYEGVSTAPPAAVVNDDSRHDDLNNNNGQQQQRAIKVMREVQATVRVTGLRYVCLQLQSVVYICVLECTTSVVTHSPQMIRDLTRERERENTMNSCA